MQASNDIEVHVNPDICSHDQKTYHRVSHLVSHRNSHNGKSHLKSEYRKSHHESHRTSFGKSYIENFLATCNSSPCQPLPVIYFNNAFTCYEI